MRFLEQGGRALAAELRELARVLFDRRLALLLGGFAVLLLLAVQLPIRYTINVGQEDGVGSDLPILSGFFTVEHDLHGYFRWTSARALVQLPGTGQRPLQFTLKVFPVSAEVAAQGPQEIELWDSGRLITRLPVLPAGAAYQLLLPPPADSSGDHMIELRSATYTPPGDSRAIGTPVDQIRFAASAGPAWPAWRELLAWLIVALLAWLALRRAGFGSRAALGMLAPVCVLAALAAWLDPPRLALGVSTALVVLPIGWLLVLLFTAGLDALLAAGALLAAATLISSFIPLFARPPDMLSPVAVLASVSAALLLGAGLRAALRALCLRLDVAIAPTIWRWLVLFAWLVFVLRFGGKIYPDSMPGDIGFHSNRYSFLIGGWLLQPSLNRGVSFPYPPAFYELLAPFSLLGVGQRVWLRLGGALLDALSAPLIYLIAQRAGRSHGQPTRQGGFDLGLAAAAIYTFSAAGFMTTWWNFSTHIFTQFAHLLLITALVLIWPRGIAYTGRLRATGALLIAAALITLQNLVYLGHFGFWMNMSLLGALLVLALFVAAIRRQSSWAAFRFALLTFVLGELLAALLFYSGFTNLFLAQIQATATGGLTGLAGRAAVDRGVLWRTLWEAGFITHFGFFPLPLALLGLLMLYGAICRRRLHLVRIAAIGGDRRYPIALLMTGTFAIGLVFAVLPFLSGSTLTTRWLMFSAWAVAVGAAVGARALWRSGRWGRLIVAVMGAYVLWVSISMWLMALAWRIRPPEPF